MMGASDSVRVYTCQWPGCVFDAARRVRRGEQMKFMCLCAHHVGQFHFMTNAECVRLSIERGPVESRRVGAQGYTRGGGWQSDLTTRET